MQDEWWYDLKHVRHRFKGYGVIQQLAEKHAKAHQFAAFASIAFSVALQVCIWQTACILTYIKVPSKTNTFLDILSATAGCCSVVIAIKS